jgi:hypothetical protein
MEIIKPHNRQDFIKINFVAEVGTKDNRLGGRPPQGVRPKVVESYTRYLLTLNLKADLAVSLFTTFDYDNPQGRFDFFSSIGQLFSEDNILIQFVLHRPIGRDSDTTLASEIPPCSFIFKDKGKDPNATNPDDYEWEEIYADHKIGGIPFFEHLAESILEDSFRLLDEGWNHFFQMASPGPNDSDMDCDWPFGGDVFNLFVRELDGGDFGFSYGWG